MNELEQAILAVGRDREIRRQLRRVRELLDGFVAEQAVLEARVEREARDVELLDLWSLDWMLAAASGTLAKVTEKERSEVLQAGFEALAHAHMIGAAEDEEERLEGLVDLLATQRLQALLVFRQAQGLAVPTHIVAELERAQAAIDRAAVVLACIRDSKRAAADLTGARTAPDRGRCLGRVALAQAIAEVEEEADEDEERAQAKFVAASDGLTHALTQSRQWFSGPPRPPTPSPAEALANLQRAHALREALLDQRDEVEGARTRLEAALQLMKREEGHVRVMGVASAQRWVTLAIGEFDRRLQREIAGYERALRASVAAEREHDRQLEVYAELMVQLAALGDCEQQLEEVWRNPPDPGLLATVLRESRRFGALLDFERPLVELQESLQPLLRPLFTVMPFGTVLGDSVVKRRRQVEAHNLLIEGLLVEQIGAYDLAIFDLAESAFSDLQQAKKMAGPHSEHAQRFARSSLAGLQKRYAREMKVRRDLLSILTQTYSTERAVLREQLALLLPQLSVEP